MEFQGRRATIIGLGRFGGGAAAARWLAGRGAAVTVTDLADRAALAESLAELEGVPVERFVFGEHREDDFRRADLAVVNPAVRPGNRFVETARAAGARVTSELELFLENCPAPVVGVTGSNSDVRASASRVDRAEWDIAEHFARFAAGDTPQFRQRRRTPAIGDRLVLRRIRQGHRRQ